MTLAIHVCIIYEAQENNDDAQCSLVHFPTNDVQGDVTVGAAGTCRVAAPTAGTRLCARRQLGRLCHLSAMRKLWLLPPLSASYHAAIRKASGAVTSTVGLTGSCI